MHLSECLICFTNTLSSDSHLLRPIQHIEHCTLSEYSLMFAYENSAAVKFSDCVVSAV